MTAALVAVALSACAHSEDREIARLQAALKAKDVRIEGLTRELGSKCATAPAAGAPMTEKAAVVRAAEEIAVAVCACADATCAAEAADRLGKRLEDAVTLDPPKTPEQAKALREAVAQSRQCIARFTPPRDAGSPTRAPF